MFDLQVVESGNGGDLLKNGNDLAMVEGFENMVYLALFGGNVKQSTPPVPVAGQQDFSWWGNALLMPNQPDLQFNSLTERTLLTVPLNSSGLQLIQNAVNADLEFMKAFADVKVAVSIITVDTLKIEVTLLQPNALQGQVFTFLWSATLAELVGTPIYFPNNQPILRELFQYSLPLYF